MIYIVLLVLKWHGTGVLILHGHVNLMFLHKIALGFGNST